MPAQKAARGTKTRVLAKRTGEAAPACEGDKAKPSVRTIKGPAASKTAKSKSEAPSKSMLGSMGEAAASAATNAPDKAVAKKPNSKIARQKALVAQIYAAIEGELTKLENQEGNKSQDRERASRALAQVVNSFKNAVQMHNEMTNTKPKGRSAEDKEALAHAEDLRREIAERIERLRMQRAERK